MLIIYLFIKGLKGKNIIYINITFEFLFVKFLNLNCNKSKKLEVYLFK